VTLADEKLINDVEELFKKARIVLTEVEKGKIEYADFGLGEDNIRKEGLQLIIYVNNERYCAKDFALLPNQTCPEHRHPPQNDKQGKMETFRCRYGKVYLYTEGSAEKKIQTEIPERSQNWYTVRHEIILNPGEQYTIQPDTRHWFQAGDEGAIVSEFSSSSDDASDVFTNPAIDRRAVDR